MFKQRFRTIFFSISADIFCDSHYESPAELLLTSDNSINNFIILNVPAADYYDFFRGTIKYFYLLHYYSQHSLK